MRFNKPPIDLQQQLQKWIARGLTVNDPGKALHYLRFIGYYRFSAYALPFQQLNIAPVSTVPDKPFRAGTSFDNILDLYVFDRELRLLVMDAVERIEVAVRTCILNEMCMKYGSHWFMDVGNFSGKFRHADFLAKLEHELDIPSGGAAPSRAHHETFINHYYQAYADPYLPPAWMVAETMPLGTWSLIFAELRQSADKNAIAAHFQTDAYILRNWLHSLTYLRNLCAHHSRLWNRQFVIKPMIARKHAGFLKSNDRFYAMAVILNELMKIIAPGTNWAQRLAGHLRAYPAVDTRAMGFPADWETLLFWK
jgi:abortive infection bacteriophage resistance protein